MRNNEADFMAFEPQKTTQNGCHVFDMWLPMPVSNNALHTTTRNGGGIILTSKARQYYADMQVLLCEYMQNTPKFSGRLAVDLWVYEPDKRKRDINNLTKSLFDALEHCGVYGNDFQIDETHIYRKEVVKGGKVHVRITQIKEHDERLTLKETTAINDFNESLAKKEEVLKTILKPKEAKHVSRFYRAQVR